jgi:hypothetical protein
MNRIVEQRSKVVVAPASHAQKAALRMRASRAGLEALASLLDGCKYAVGRKREVTFDAKVNFL